MGLSQKNDRRNTMKKIISVFLCIAMLATCCVAFASCGKKTFEIAVVTDVGQLMDGGFNQGTYEGAKAYAEKNGLTYKYYQPDNGSDASDNDRIAAMRQAINNGAKIIVTPGYLQETAIKTVATENPDVKFVFVDGWALGLDNVTAITYKEQECGYMAGYAVVKEGYTKLGYTGGGGGANPACNRFGYGFVQGAEAAAKELGKNITIKYSYKYGDSFSASPDLQTQIAGWYAAGTEVVFSCGGSMLQSVKSAAAEYPNAKIVGVDTDQSAQSAQIITSAMKELAVSVQQVLGQFYADKWNTELANKVQDLGAADNATGLPTAKDSWRFSKFTVAEYTELFNKIKDGTIVPVSKVPEAANYADWLSEGLTNTTIDFEK